MKIYKLILITIALFIFTSSYLFAQPKEIDDLIKEQTRFNNPPELKEANGGFSKKVFNKNNTNRVSRSVNIESNMVMGGALTIDRYNNRKQYTFTYDNNGKMTSEVVEKNSEKLSKQSYTYDSKGNRTMWLDEYWGDTSWVSDVRQTYTYSGKGNMISHLVEKLMESDWENKHRVNYTYNSSGNVILESTVLYWSNTDSYISYEYTYTYDGHGKLISKLEERWNWTGQNMEIHSRNTYTYNSNGNQTSDIFEYWYAPNWEQNERTTMTYDSSGNMTSLLEEQFDYENWVGTERFTMTYDSNGNITSEVYQDWNETVWENKRQLTYTYDNNENMTSELRKDWNGTIWENEKLETYTYDSNGNFTFSTGESWRSGTWQLSSHYIWFTDSYGNSYQFLGSKVEMVYMPITDIDEESVAISKFSLSQNYPNPFNPSTTIKYSIPSVENANFRSVQLKVYDVLGREVATLVNKEQQPGNYEVKFNASSLTSGVYFYRIQAGDPAKGLGQVFIETKKMILLR